MFKKYLHFIIVISIFITSCKTAKHTSNAETKSNKESNKTKHILDGNWVFVTMPGKDVKLTELFPNKMPEAMIDVSQGKISGYAGCNRFSARMTVDKDNIKFIQPLLLTKTACATMSDNAFLGILENTNRFEVRDSFAHFYSNKFEMMTMKRVKK